MEPLKNQCIVDLTAKFLEEGLSQTEVQELKMLLKDPVNHDYFKKSYLIWNSKYEEKDHENIDAIFSSLLSEINQQTQTPVNKRFSFVALIAAASIIAFVLGVGSYYFFFDSHRDMMNLKGNNFAMLHESIPVRIYAPFGSKSVVSLPDGSSVTLNAGSTLEYTNDFGKKQRQVSLEGEAYFKVVKDKDCPFAVKAQNTVITALGTEFNVKAYSEEGLVQTTLVEGSVSVCPILNTKGKMKDILLKPSQMLTVLNDNSIHFSYKQTSKDKQLNASLKSSPITTKTVNTLLYTSWKDSCWVINGLELEELALQLQRRYNVNVAITSSYLKSYKFSGTLKDETLEQVLDIIKSIAPINYFIDKKTVVLSVNANQQSAFEKSMTK